MHMVAIIGGAVAGSEAAVMCAERGVEVVVLEQGARPYGKIEDGLPRWHTKLRLQEYARIDANLSRPEIRFIPCTRVGEDVSLQALLDLGFSAILFATGAWRDRSLPIPGVDAYVGRGLQYQNAFIQAFNDGRLTDDDLPEGAIVVGGGLASVDVAKVLSLETHVRALRAQGHELTVDDLEARGIPRWCEAAGVDLPQVAPPTIFYRRGMEDMPLMSMPPDADEAAVAKTRAARVKIMTRLMDRYRVAFEGFRVPSSAIVEGESLVGLEFAETRSEGRRVVTTDNRHEVRASLVVSSIGSLPVPIEGMPMKGELYDYEDWETGAIRGLPGVFGLGNVLTGRGNIKDSRTSGREIATRVLEERLRRQAKDAVAKILDAALEVPDITPEARARIDAFVAQRWAAVDYPGPYDAWIAEQRKA